MSNTDSFIDEVNEEVRRDKLYAALRRYGWIAALAVFAIVGAAAWNEYRKAQAQAAAQAVGDAMLTALALETPMQRLDALAEVPTQQPGSAAVNDFMRAAQAAEAGERDTAVAALEAVAVNGEVPEIYRQLAAFKSLTLQMDTMPVEELRRGLEGLALPGAPLALLAQEQLALLSVREGDVEAGITQYRRILQDANATADLQQRALQVIVALGGSPMADAAETAEN